VVKAACPCGSGVEFSDCCEPFFDGSKKPLTAEALMRSRYTAYVRQDVTYLKNTLWPKFQAGFDFAATARWALENHWTGLAVLETEKGGQNDRDGIVQFEAKYLSGGTLHVHREKSRFRKKSGRWYYVEAI